MENTSKGTAAQKSAVVIILILGALTAVSPFSIDMYLPAFGQMAKDLDTTVPKVSLSLSSYFVGMAVGQLLYGPLLDRFGRKRPLYAGLVLYILATAACLLSRSVEVLIAFRFLQALGGCAAGVASTAMVRDFFPEQERAKVFSMLMLILSVSPLFAPTIGSLLSSSWGWQSVFVVLGIIMTLILLLVVFALPEGHQPDITVSLKAKPIINNFLSIFRTNQFFAYALSGAFSFAGLFVYLAGAPSIFMNTFQLTEKQFGLVFALLSIGVVGGGQVNIQLTKRYTSEQIFRAALMTQVLTTLVFLPGVYMGWYGLTMHIVLFFIFLSCIGLTYPNAATLALQPFQKNGGAAAALLGFLQMGVGALSSAMFGLLGFGASVSVGVLFLITSICGLVLSKIKPRAVVHSAGL
ncbi:MAG: Bcr/CflA family efflux MFS transporter [Sphingobacteriales bacterium]|nr:MAG: Bcr/CflA family efflux MFS transporter [Sphingobacteriales bacterium]